MRYWDSGDDVTKARPVRRSPRAKRPAVASGGSAGPFLRRFYRPTPAVSETVFRLAMLLAAAGLIYAFVLGDGGVVRLAMLRAERARETERVARLEKARERLVETARALRDDPLAIETVGRERYGMIRPGEKVVRFLPPETGEEGRTP